FNLGNRKILQSHVETIARDIKRGDWMFNAQPICFSNTGRLLNGQHRLRACALAGEPIDVIIVTGLPDEAFATYDIHARKTAATDMISGDVRADMRVVAAAAKLQWAMEQEESGIIVTSSPSATEIRRTIEAHPGLIEAYPRARRMADIASAGIMNFVVYRTRAERPDLAEDFLDGLETGAGLEKKNPILKTRNMLLVERNAPGAYRRKRFLAEILECWEDYKLWRDDPGSARKKRRSTRADKESQA